MGVIALSWSRISDYRQCAHKYRLKYIDKVPNFQMKQEDKNPALVRGGNIHKGLEKYVVCKLQKIEFQSAIPEVLSTAPLIDNIMEHYNVMSEKQIAIDVNFKEISWFAKDAWFRVIYDLVGFGNDLLLGDYKTGKFADYSGSVNELGQLHMAAVVGMGLWPEYDDCSSIYIYVDHKRTIPVRLNRKKYFHLMKDKLCEEHALINSDTEFPERKNRYCYSCEATFQQCIHKRK